MTPTRITPSTVRSIARNVQKANQETKARDVTGQSDVSVASGNFQLVLNPLNQGPGSYQRLGNRIQPVGMAVNMQTHCTTYATVRTLIVEKKSPLDSFNTDGFQDNDASITSHAQDYETQY
jgi:hypothetical protein